MARRKLDLWLPPTSGPHPIVVYMHGGRFVSGSKSELGAPFRNACLNNGWAVASVGYRLAPPPQLFVDTNPGPHWPQQIIDFKRAVRWLVNDPLNLGFNIDDTRVVFAGHSAGGHMSIAAALSPGQHVPAGGEVLPIGVMALAPPTRLNTSPLNAFPLLSDVQSYVGCGWVGTCWLISNDEFKLDTQVNSSSPPARLWFAEIDPLITGTKHQNWLVDAYNAAGRPIQSSFIGGADHDTIRNLVPAHEIASFLNSL